MSSLGHIIKQDPEGAWKVMEAGKHEIVLRGEINKTQVRSVHTFQIGF